MSTGEEFSKEDSSYKYASGGLVSTSEDLVAFGYSLLKARSDSLTNQLFQTMYSGNGKPTNYGIGWNIGKDFTGQPIYFHSSNMINGSGYLILYPEQDMVLAFLANGPGGLLFDLQKLAALFYQNHD